MGDSGSQSSESGGSGNVEISITAREAYNRHNVEGETQTEIAEDVGVSQSYISRLVNGYKEGRESGRESVDPEDFTQKELADALGDEAPESNPFETECPRCGELISPPDSAGVHDCPECGDPLEWSEDEI